MPKLIRITTAPISLHVLLRGQMRYMQEHGMEVTMVSSDGKELPVVLQQEGVPHHIIPMTRRMTPFKDLRCLWLLYRYFKKEKPDIVHSHTPKAGLLAMLAAKMAGIPIRIHTIAGLRYVTTRGFSRRLLIKMEKWTGRAATHVWPNSFSLQQFIIDQQLVKKSKLEVIGHGSSNGVNLVRYSLTALQPERLAETKKQIRFEEQLIYFLSVGRIVHDKGIDELVHAFLRVYENNKATRLILVGAFEDEVDPVSDDTKKIIREHPGIIMAGWSDAVEYFMALSYALIHPSHREGFPNVLLQAGAMQCPIICSRIEGNVDIVTDRQTGLIFPVSNEDELYRQMQFALANPAAMRQYAQALRQQIEQFYNQPVIHGLLLNKYRELLAAQ